MGTAQGCMTKEKVVTANGQHAESAHLESQTQTQNEDKNPGYTSSELGVENDPPSFNNDAIDTVEPSLEETDTHEETIREPRIGHFERADTGFSEDREVVEITENMSLSNSACQVQIQKPAPSFRGQAVVSGQFKEIGLQDYKGKYVVLFFYPLDFTFVCPTEIIAFSDRVEDFRDIGCELIACSTDSHYSHFAWVNTTRKNGGLGEMNIPLLSDKTGEISRKYGVYKEDEGIAYRGLFIIDEKQNLRQITINDLPVGRSVDETLRLVQAFQFTDKHGEVCPAGWKPGAKTIKPSVEESKAYFKNV